MAHRKTSQLLAAAILTSGAATALALTSPAGAENRAVERFDGVCQMSGAVRHDPPLTAQPLPTEIRGSFRGTCSGQLTDGDGRTRQLDDAPARYEVQDAGGDLSCLGGTATGSGSLRFGGGHDIEFTLTERRPGPGVAIVSLVGTAGGSATVFGTVSQNEDLVKLNDRCNGQGVRVVHGDARIESTGLSG
jgi:hypothetical protein